MNARHLVPLLAVALAATIALPTALAGPVATSTTGPYVDTIVQDETNVHGYDNVPPGTSCLGIYRPTKYTVRIEHAPTDDAVTIAADGVWATTSNGVATISFVRNYCTAFDISVVGTDVDDKAAYVVTVTSSQNLIGGSWS